MRKLVLVALAMVSIFNVAAADVYSVSIYPETARIVELNYDEDIVIVETFTGFLFSFYGCEDWSIGDCCSMIMSDNGTETMLDDQVIVAEYSGWGLINWMEEE